MLRRLNPDIALGFLLATVLWIGVLGWALSYAPTEIEKQECQQAAKKAGRKTEECKTFWERTTSDPVAFYTLGLFIFTGVLGFTAIIQIRFLRKADETAHISADAAKLSAEVAAAGFRAAISILRVEFTDWTETIAQEKKAFRAHTTLVIGNKGGGNADVVSLHTFAAIGPVPPKEPEPWEEWKFKEGLFIPARDELRMGEGDSQFLVTEEMKEKITKGETFLWYWGCLRYRDYFGDMGDVGFLFRYRQADRNFMESGWREVNRPNYTYHRKLPKKA